MQEQPQNQINPDLIINSLREQRNEATDALALLSARLQEATQANQRLLGYLNDVEFITQRLKDLTPEADAKDEAPAPKRKAKAAG